MCEFESHRFRQVLYTVSAKVSTLDFQSEDVGFKSHTVYQSSGTIEVEKAGGV